MNRQLVRGSPGTQFAGARSTAAKYSNAIGFGRASLPSNAQIRAQTCLGDRHAPSSQREGRLVGERPGPIHSYGACGGAHRDRGASPAMAITVIDSAIEV